jgi:hypothetical protein
MNFGVGELFGRHGIPKIGESDPQNKDVPVEGIG